MTNLSFGLLTCGKALEDYQWLSLQTCISVSLWGSLVPRAKPQGKQRWMCIHTRETFPGAARLALWGSDLKLRVAGQQEGERYVLVWQEHVSRQRLTFLDC